MIFSIVESDFLPSLEVIRVEYDLNELKISLEPNYDVKPIVVTFDGAVGFRVLDEGDLLEFWGDVTLSDGWLFQIESGGWLDLEAQREGFLTKHNNEIVEFLVIGQNECVSILACGFPVVSRPKP